MGFKRSTSYKLKFTDPGYSGFECVMRSMSVGELEQIASLQSLLKGTAETDTAGVIKAVDALCRRFSASLVGWNLEDEQDRPVPATYEGVKSQDVSFILAIVEAWLNAVAAVPPPLPGPSPNGGTPALEESLGLGSLQTSRGS